MKDGQTLLAGLSIGGTLIIAYLVYKAIGDYQTSRRIANIDYNIAKFTGGKPYKSRLLEKITLEKETEKLGEKIDKII